MRSRAACSFLAQHGFAQLANLRGGMAEWAAAGLAVVRGAGPQQEPGPGTQRRGVFRRLFGDG